MTEEEMKALPIGAVISAKKVDMALITYVGQDGRSVTQAALVGDNTVHLLESRSIGLSPRTTPQGKASPATKEGVMKALGKTSKGD